MGFIEQLLFLSIPLTYFSGIWFILDFPGYFTTCSEMLIYHPPLDPPAPAPKMCDGLGHACRALMLCCIPLAPALCCCPDELIAKKFGDMGGI